MEVQDSDLLLARLEDHGGGVEQEGGAVVVFFKAELDLSLDVRVVVDDQVLRVLRVLHLSVPAHRRHHPQAADLTGFKQA